MVKLHLGYLRIARKCVSANACKSIGVNNENEFYCDLLFVCIKHTPTEEWPLEKIHARQRYLVLGPVFSHKNHIQFFVYRKNRGFFFCYFCSSPGESRKKKGRREVQNGQRSMRAHEVNNRIAIGWIDGCAVCVYECRHRKCYNTPNE